MSTIPHHTPPHPPREMRWEYRGTGWKYQGETVYYTVTREGRTWLSVPQKPRGEPDLHYFEAVPISLPASQTLSADPKPTPASTSSSNLGHPQDAIVIGHDMTHQPYPVDDWHGPLKGPIRPFGSDPSNQVARWQHGDWDFTGWEGSSTDHYLVRKGTALAVELGLEPTYPDHTPPELPSPWHRWEYRGTGVEDLQPTWYSVCQKGTVGPVVTKEVSIGYDDVHYFEAVPTVPLLHVNGIYFPEPCREPLEMGQIFFIAVPDYKTGWRNVRWHNDEHDNRWLAAGLVHLCLEAAAAHSKAMLSLAAKGGAR